MFEVRIQTGNEAFGEDEASAGHELGRILDVITQAIQGGRTSGKCMDYNGNAVGNWTYTNTEDK